MVRERHLIDRNCVRCGSDFQAPPYIVARGDGRFCKPSCVKPVAPISIRLWSRVEKSEECWEWTGPRSVKGYGKVRIGSRTDKSRRTAQAHRLAWELTNGNHPCMRGPMLPHIQVLHHCDNPPCVRPDHLFLGTNRDNSLDMVRKHRNGRRVHPDSYPVGERHLNAKLTAALVIEFRERIATTRTTYQAIANEYGLSRKTVSNAVQGKSWRSVGVPLVFAPGRRGTIRTRLITASADVLLGARHAS